MSVIVGIAIGIILAVVLIGILIQRNQKISDKIERYNQESLRALLDRNEIGLQCQDIQERMLGRITAGLFESNAKQERIANSLAAINRNLESQQ